MIVVLAHRGSHGPGGATENTLPAFEAAIREGADFIELDLWATRDGVPFVHHDPSLGAATGGREPRGIPEMTAAEARQVILEGGERLPSLDDVLDLAAGRVALNLELKDRRSLPATVAAVRARRLTDQVILSSFDAATLVAARDDAPEIARGLIMGTFDTDPRVRLRESFPFWQLRRCDAAFWHPHWRLVHRAVVDAVHRLGVTVNVWTVNDAARARAVVRAGADGIFTDRPGALRSALLG